MRTRLATDLRQILVEAGTTALMVTHDHTEAFAVADRVAVMRAGRVVQEGRPEEVWAAPVDAETALFLGYSRVLHGAAARTLQRAAGGADASTGAAAVAVRRSALTAVADPTGGVLRGVVAAVTPTADEVRLGVTVDGVGDLEALGPAGWLPTVGEEIGLRVDPARLAVLSPDAGPGGGGA